MNENDLKIEKEMFLKLANTCNDLTNSYKEIYHKQYSQDIEERSNEAGYILDLYKILAEIKAIASVYARDNKVNSNYALEKLSNIQNVVNDVTSYFKTKEVER